MHDHYKIIFLEKVKKAPNMRSSKKTIIPNTLFISSGSSFNSP